MDISRLAELTSKTATDHHTGGYATSKNATDFNALVTKGDTRTLKDGEVYWTQLNSGESTRRHVTRFRSGSITESHEDLGGGGKHRAYHWSQTANEGRGELFQAPSRNYSSSPHGTTYSK